MRALSVLVAVGVNTAGYREILGLQLGDSESERSWMAFFTWLKGRGLAGVDLVVSDHHGGLVTAIRVQFQGASWQRCQTHLAANVADATPTALQEEVHSRLHAIFDAPDPQTARTLLARFVADFEQTAPGAVATLEGASTTPQRSWPCRCPTARGCAPPMGSSGASEEIRRRERVIRIFPNRASAIRLLGALLMEHDEAWTTGHRYFDMSAYWQWRASQDQEAALPHTA